MPRAPARSAATSSCRKEDGYRSRHRSRARCRRRSSVPAPPLLRARALFRLAPINPAERDQAAEARRGVEAAQAEEQLARQRLQRLEQLLKDGATSMRAVEEARAQLEVATATLNAARERLKTHRTDDRRIWRPCRSARRLPERSCRYPPRKDKPSPRRRRSRRSRRSSTLWVKVPLYAGDASAVDPSKPAFVTTLGSSRSARPAVRITAPPTANPTSASVDLFYEVHGSGETPLRPGERVTVQLPLKATEQRARRAGSRGALRHQRRHMGLRRSRQRHLRATPDRHRQTRRQPGGRRSRDRAWHSRRDRRGRRAVRH